MRQIAGNDEPNYIRECGKAWDKLWDYFDVAEYKDICFPETKKWFLTSQEKDFLKSYFAEVCREGKDDKTGKGYDRTAKREVKSFLDKRKTKLEYDEKEKIEWAARNLYQMIRVRSGITEEIRGKFYKSTRNPVYPEPRIRKQQDKNVYFYIYPRRKVQKEWIPSSLAGPVFPMGVS